MLNLWEDLPALLIINVFSGQMTDPVIKMLREKRIKIFRVPANMTNLFKTQGFAVNGSAKAYMKRMFTEWYNTYISR